MPAAGTTYEDVAISWTAAENAYLTVTDGVLTVNALPTEDTEVTLTAALACGEATDTKDFTVTVKAAEEEEPEAYKMYMHQKKAAEPGIYFFNGAKSGNYLASSSALSDAVDVFFEETEGGYRIYFLDNGAKKYIDIYEYTTNKMGVQITDAPTAVFTYNETYDTYLTAALDTEYYFGAYSTYTTFSANKISYLTEATFDETQFPAHFIKSENAEDFDKLMSAKYGLTLSQTSFTENAEVTLPTADGVTIGWTLSDTTYFTVSNGALIFTRGSEAIPNDVEVSLTATMRVNSQSTQKVFKLTVVKDESGEEPQKEFYTVDEILAVMANYTDNQISTEEYTVKGVVTSSSYNSSYSSYTIWLQSDDGTTAQAFELYSVGMDSSITEDYTAANALVGKTVTCVGYIEKYVKNGNVTYEMPYLKASLSPTGAAYTPTVTAVED